MSPTNVELVPSGTPQSFTGLSLSSRTEALLDGMGGHDWWWYAVGYTKHHRDGNPAVLVAGTNGYTAQKTELFVFIPGQ